MLRAHFILVSGVILLEDLLEYCLLKLTSGKGTMLRSKLSTLPVLLLVAVRLFCAIKGIISDCDEVYNYWDPLNFFIRYFGKQTWEYSPEYAIRSWAFIAPFSVFKYPFQLLQAQINIPYYYYFYLIRIVNAALMAGGEISLATAVNRLSPGVANWFLLFEIFNPGMSHASISLLPSSFCLMLNFYSTAEIVKYIKYNRLHQKTISAIKLVSGEEGKLDKNYEKLTAIRDALVIAKRASFAWTMVLLGLGGVLGWPFTLILYVPFVLYCSCEKIVCWEIADLLLYGVAGLTSLGFTAIMSIQIDWYFYKLSSFIPYNIVAYNVFNASADSGPNIFGTEPLSYYIYNLLLNFNIMIPLALVGLVVSPFLAYSMSFKLSFIDWHVIYLPALIWCGIFFTQPHKEERFLYPIYHLITLSASLGAYTITRIFGTNKVLAKGYHMFSKATILVAVILISTGRILSLIENYSSPLTVFQSLPYNPSKSEELVCMGREWYHYPSSFFLHDNQRMQFVENGFRGMLPGDFPEPENKTFSGLSDSISFVPTHFNNKNQYNPDLTVSFDQCDYYFDLDIPVDTSMGEIEMFKTSDRETIILRKGWSLVKCDKFIDSSRSHGLSKILYIPPQILQFLDAAWLTSYIDGGKLESVFRTTIHRLPLILRGKIPQPRVEQVVKGIHTGVTLTHEGINKLVEVLDSKVEYNQFCLAQKD